MTSKTYEDGLREGRLECAEIADVVGDEADAESFSYEDDDAVGIYRAREESAREIAKRIRAVMGEA